jgi:hypothetical protein
MTETRPGKGKNTKCPTYQLPTYPNDVFRYGAPEQQHIGFHPCKKQDINNMYATTRFATGKVSQPTLPGEWSHYTSTLKEDFKIRISFGRAVRPFDPSRSLPFLSLALRYVEESKPDVQCSRLMPPIQVGFPMNARYCKPSRRHAFPLHRTSLV